MCLTEAQQIFHSKMIQFFDFPVIGTPSISITIALFRAIYIETKTGP
jgi:hypothetical protein